MKKILITGGTGMVGRNLRNHAAARNYEIVSPGSREVDLRDFAATSAFVADQKPDLIVHTAGRVGGIQANTAKPVEFMVENLDMGRNIVMAARETRVPQMINLGSSCMYPKKATNPLREDMLLTGAFEPTNEGYALAKVMTARLCDYVSRTDPEVSYKTLIPCNLYGPYDKFEAHVSHLLPAIIEKVHAAQTTGGDKVEIWGDGNARREFLYGGDFADAVWSAVDGFDRLPSTMNVGVGDDHSINDYYRAVADVIGWDGEFVHDLSKPVGMKRKLVSTERQKEFGWSPKTPLADGIKLTYDYFVGAQK